MLLIRVEDWQHGACYAWLAMSLCSAVQGCDVFTNGSPEQAKGTSWTPLFTRDKEK